jgi:hypothetical protein
MPPGGIVFLKIQTTARHMADGKASENGKVRRPAVSRSNKVIMLSGERL